MAFGNNNSRIWKIYLVLFKLFEGRLEIPFDVIFDFNRHVISMCRNYAILGNSNLLFTRMSY